MRSLIPWLAAASAALYGALVALGDLRTHVAAFLACHAALALLAALAFRAARGRPSTGFVIAAALVFRLISAFGEPTLSDDVYRYVWDGRVQVHGHHPYQHAPLDATLAGLRDEHWKRINHPEVKTIYPPLAQSLFRLLALVGAGPGGFKLALALADFGVVLLLARLLARARLPRRRLILYAWNPLAVIESAGSGHLEPVGVALVLLATLALLSERRGLAALALAAGIQIKLLPALLLPAHLRRSRWRGVLLVGLFFALPIVPYALGGPAVGAGLFAYAERWEYNATLYAGVEAFLPRFAARVAVACAALGWALWLALVRRPPLLRESLWVMGGVLLLSPTLHPWYLLWILPLAAALGSWGWLALGVTIPLTYATAGVGDVSWGLRIAEYLPPLALAAWQVGRSPRSGSMRA